MFDLIARATGVQLSDKRGARMCHLKDFTDRVSVAYLCGCGRGSMVSQMF